MHPAGNPFFVSHSRFACHWISCSILLVILISNISIGNIRIPVPPGVSFFSFQHLSLRVIGFWFHPAGSTILRFQTSLDWVTFGLPLFHPAGSTILRFQTSPACVFPGSIFWKYHSSFQTSLDCVSLRFPGFHPAGSTILRFQTSPACDYLRFLPSAEYHSSFQTFVIVSFDFPGPSCWSTILHFQTSLDCVSLRFLVYPAGDPFFVFKHPLRVIAISFSILLEVPFFVFKHLSIAVSLGFPLFHPAGSTILHFQTSLDCVSLGFPGFHPAGVHSSFSNDLRLGVIGFPVHPAGYHSSISNISLDW
ncbi:hypothetical protein AVEN_120236-1 [Araneus ventricosus]|uniref:Uncharacterized protein n=1 Tax=Araneus ventricosus TaxID=182803 RepID=A0A4Y2RNB0_ARAVE|nr:hypothetical protein AVEN_120236-1 [Araneus ventricosus]